VKFNCLIALLMMMVFPKKLTLWRPLLADVTVQCPKNLVQFENFRGQKRSGENWILDHFHNFQPTNEIKPKFDENHEYRVLLGLQILLTQFWKFFDWRGTFMGFIA
jgi:hypothetical protein